MRTRLIKIVAGVAALAAFALGGATLAGATGGPGSEGPEQRLTGQRVIVPAGPRQSRDDQATEQDEPHEGSLSGEGP